MGELGVGVFVELHWTCVGVVPALDAAGVEADERVDVGGSGRLGGRLLEQYPVDFAGRADRGQVEQNRRNVAAFKRFQHRAETVGAR